jgi:hypothetical protein
MKKLILNIQTSFNCNKVLDCPGKKNYCSLPQSLPDTELKVSHSRLLPYPFK